MNVYHDLELHVDQQMAYPVEPRVEREAQTATD